MELMKVAFRGKGTIRGTNFEHSESSSTYKSDKNKNGSAKLAKAIAEGIMSLFDGSILGVAITDQDQLYCELTTIGDPTRVYQVLYDDSIIQMYSNAVQIDTSFATRHMFVPLLVEDILSKNNTELLIALQGLREAVRTNGLPLDKNHEQTKKYFFLTNDHFYYNHVKQDYNIVVDRIIGVKIKEDITVKITGEDGKFQIIQPATKKPKSVPTTKKSNSKKKYKTIDFGEPLSDEMIKKIPKLPDYMKIPEEIVPVVNSVAGGSVLAFLQEGPTGTGKTTNVELICREIKLPLITKINCTQNLDEFILGKFIPDGTGNYIFKESEVTEAIRWGGAVVFEEINFGKPEHLAFLNSLLDNNAFVRLDNGEVVHRHPCFRFFATMNNGYEGTKPLNKALRNRFNAIAEVEGLSVDDMKKTLKMETSLSAETIDNILFVYDKICTKIEQEELDTAISLRNLLNWGKQIPDSDFYTASILTVVNPVSDGDKDLKKELIDIVKLKAN